MSSAVKSSLVVIGQLGGSYGVRGWHHVTSFAQPQDNLLAYKLWYVQQNGQWQSFELLEGRRHGKSLVAHLKGVDSPEEAAKMSQCKIAVLRDEFAPLSSDEFYWVDLEGLGVQTVDGNQLGVIEYLYENAGTDVMVVKTADKDLHIPFMMNDTVISVDLETKIVIVDWDPNH